MSDVLPAGTYCFRTEPQRTGAIRIACLEEWNRASQGRLHPVSLTENQPGYVSLTHATAYLPGRRAGKKISVQTLWRWCTRGLRGIRLRSVMVGGHRCTTLQWIEEFIDAVTQMARHEGVDLPELRTTKQKETASERATKDLRAAWERPAR